MCRRSARWRRKRSGPPTSSNMPACGSRSRRSRHRDERAAYAHTVIPRPEAEGPLLWPSRSLAALGMTAGMAKFIANIPKIVVAFLLVAAIVNLLIGVFLRYVMIEVTDWLDLDPIRFTWVEEVGEMLLAWLT